MSAKLEFKNNKEKVKYLADHFITLQNILDMDEPLTTMLIDMINRGIYGKDTPSIAKSTLYIPTPVLDGNLSLPLSPDKVNIKLEVCDDNIVIREKEQNKVDIDKLTYDNDDRIIYDGRIIYNDRSENGELGGMYPVCSIN